MMLRVIPVLVTVATLSAATGAQAKDLRNRIGAGMDTQMSLRGDGNFMPTNLSLKYTFPASDKTINIQTELLLGMSVKENAGAYVSAGGRFLYTVVAEDNCNVYVGTGLSYFRAPDLPGAYVRLQPLAGVESRTSDSPHRSA